MTQTRGKATQRKRVRTTPKLQRKGLAPGCGRLWAGVGLVVVVTALLYLPALNNGFTNWDDDKQVVANPVIRDLSAGGLKDIFSSFTVSLYQPLTSLVFALQYRFFELDPRVYHTVNVVLHLANIVLVYVLIRSLSQQPGIALIVAALFAVHPLQVEAVAWVSSLSILLSSLFYLAGLIVYLSYTRSGRKSRLAVVWGLALLALLAKTSAATFPLVLLVIDLFLRRGPVRRLVLEKVPFFLLSLIFGTITVFARSGAGHLQDFALRYSLLERACIVSYSCLWYVGKLLCPTDLSVFYPFPSKADGWLPVLFYLAPVALIALVVTIWFSGRHRRLLAFVALFMLATLVLVIQVVPISELMVCDRYAYLPGIGLFFLAGVLAVRISARGLRWKAGTLTCLAAVLSLFGYATFQRVEVWKDSLTLWNDVIDQRADIWVAYLNRGLAKAEMGRHAEAIADFDEALRLNPRSDLALNNRAGCHVYLDHWQAALEDFSRAIEVNPKPDYLINRGVAKRRMGDPAGAVEDFSTVLARDAQNVRALCERADAYRAMEEWAKALADYEAVLRLHPQHAHATFWLGAVRLQTGATEQAVTLLSKAIDLGYPDLGSAYLFLGIAYQRLGQTERAIETLRKSQQTGDPRATIELRKMQAR